MNYSDRAKHLARVLKDKLTREEFDILYDLLGDYATDDWLYKEMGVVSREPVPDATPTEPTPKTWHNGLMDDDEDSDPR